MQPQKICDTVMNKIITLNTVKVTDSMLLYALDGSTLYVMLEYLNPLGPSGQLLAVTDTNYADLLTLNKHVLIGVVTKINQCSTKYFIFYNINIPNIKKILPYSRIFNCSFIFKLD